MQDAAKIPTLIKIPEWGRANGFSRAQAYAAADKMPPGVRVKIGGRLRLNAEALAEYLRVGGDLANGPA